MQPLPTTSRRLPLVVFGCLQNIFAGGLIYGWTGIAGTILTAQRSEGGAGLSPATTLNIFSIASSFSCFSQLFLGIVQDAYNPKICSIISNVIVGLGCFIFVSSSSEEAPMALYLGCTMMGFGGPGVQLSLIHLSNLFPGKENTVMSFMTGTINLSFVVLPIINSVWNSTHVSYQLLFRFLGGGILTMALVSVWIWPNVTYHRLEDGNVRNDERESCIDCDSDKDESCCSSDCSDIDMEISLSHQGPINILETEQNLVDVKHRSTHAAKAATLQSVCVPLDGDPIQWGEQGFVEQVFSGRLIRLATFFVVTSFWANYYIGSMTIEVKDEELFDEETLNQLIQTFSYISVAGTVFSGIAGYCQDTIGSSQTNIITCIIGTAQMIFILSANSEPQMVASFVMYSLFRSFLYPSFFSGLATSFGFKYYGALSGLVLALSGAIFLVGVPVLSGFAIGTCHEAAKEECFHGRWKTLHAAQIISMILLLLMEVVYQDGKQSVGYYQKPENNLEVYNYGSVGGSELVRVRPPTA